MSIAGAYQCLSLIVAYFDPVQNGATALIVAAQEGHLRVVEMLLEANGNINVKDNVRPTMHGTVLSIIM